MKGCPTLFEPMASGDGLLVRVKPPGGVLGAEAARILASAAARHGNGAIDLGNRASLQIRGLRADTAAPFASAMVAAGLAHPDPPGERRRNVIAPPLAGDDPTATPRAATIVACIEAMQARESSLAPLHGKFGVLVDAGGVLPVASAVADIRILLAPDSATILLDGSDLAAACNPTRPSGDVLALSLAFLGLAARQPDPPHRMRALVAAIGAEAVFAAAGLAPTPKPSPLVGEGWVRGDADAESGAARPLTPALIGARLGAFFSLSARSSRGERVGVRWVSQRAWSWKRPSDSGAAACPTSPRPSPPQRGGEGEDGLGHLAANLAPMTPALSHEGRGSFYAPPVLGWLPYPGTDRGAFGAGLPFGSTDAATLAALADLAERHGDGTLRLTPWRAFVLPGVTAPGPLHADLTSLGLIVAPDDARAHIAACPGQPTCASATVPTRADAARIAALRLPGTLHVSGCAKGCAHPAIADVTLVGDSGRYAIVRNGRAGDPPWVSGLTIADAIKTLAARTEGKAA